MKKVHNLIIVVSNFIEHKKGAWGNDDRDALFSELKERGYDTSNEELQNLIDSLLESITSLRLNLSSQGKSEDLISGLSDDTISFIENSSVLWGYNDWMNFISNIHKVGINITDDTISYFGNILNSAQQISTAFYNTDSLDNINDQTQKPLIDRTTAREIVSEIAEELVEKLKSTLGELGFSDDDIMSTIMERTEKKTGKRIKIKSDFKPSVKDETQILKTNIDKIEDELETEHSDIDESIDLLNRLKNKP